VRQYGGSVVARDLRARPAAPADTPAAPDAADAVLKRQALHAAQARAPARPAQPTNPARPTAGPGIAARRLSRVCGRQLSLSHPISGAALTFRAPLAPDMRELLALLRARGGARCAATPGAAVELAAVGAGAGPA
jgi:hypothetical protein